MNRNLRKSLWVLALGIAFAGLSTASRAAALPAQRDLDQDRNQNRTRNDNPKGDRVYFQQGAQDGQHDRQFGSNQSDHPQPTDAKAIGLSRLDDQLGRLAGVPDRLRIWPAAPEEGFSGL